eukprot:4008686-Prorocentrum_lima.AAC.1
MAGACVDDARLLFMVLKTDEAWYFGVINEWPNVGASLGKIAALRASGEMLTTRSPPKPRI